MVECLVRLSPVEAVLINKPGLLTLMKGRKGTFASLVFHFQVDKKYKKYKNKIQI